MRSAPFVKTLAVGLALAVLLAACGSTRIVQAPPSPLPAAPDRYRECFAGTTVLPAGAWSAAMTADIVARLRVSELAKTDCGRDFLAWYEELKRLRDSKE